MSIVPVLWIPTTNPANLRCAPEAAAIGIGVPEEFAAFTALEWRGWGRVMILVSTREPPGLTGEYDLYLDQVTSLEARIIEAALARLVS